MTAARAAALALITLALAACGSGGNATSTETTNSTTTTTAATTTTTTAHTTTAPPTPVRLVVTVGPKGVAGGPKQLSLKQGVKALLVVHSALADEVHFHGYDLSKDVSAGGTVTIPFTATIPGRFEVELESRKLPIAELEVTP
jgi:hypothetical protein